MLPVKVRQALLELLQSFGLSPARQIRSQALTGRAFGVIREAHERLETERRKCLPQKWGRAGSEEGAG